MKRCPRRLPLFSLSLIPFVWAGGSDVGVAMHGGAVTRESSAQLQILSFTATPTVIRSGEEVVLRWRVSGAEHIWLSIAPTLDATRCIEQEAGEIRVTPSVDGTPMLHAYGQGRHVSQGAPIQVDAEGFCTISGEVARDKKEYGTSVALHRLSSKTPTLTATLDSLGRYSFSRVPVGDYRVVLTGRYPSSVMPSPRSESIQCFPNGSHRANFTIASTEGRPTAPFVARTRQVAMRTKPDERDLSASFAQTVASGRIEGRPRADVDGLRPDRRSICG